VRHGAREGCKVAMTPLFTDLPIIGLTLVLAAKLAELRSLLGVVSLAGGVFVLWLAWATLRPSSLDTPPQPESSNSWFKGILTNLLSPHPWLFWLTVGAATLAKAFAQSWLAAGAFLVGFYLLLIGSKVLVALLAARARHWLTGKLYRVTMRVLATGLVFFALLLFREAFANWAG